MLQWKIKSRMLNRVSIHTIDVKLMSASLDMNWFAYCKQDVCLSDPRKPKSITAPRGAWKRLPSDPNQPESIRALCGAR